MTAWLTFNAPEVVMKPYRPADAGFVTLFIVLSIAGAFDRITFGILTLHPLAGLSPAVSPVRCANVMTPV